MSMVDQAFDTALATLRERYVSGLGGSIAELKKFAVLREFNKVGAEATAAIGQLAHKLSGTGETLGFAAISATATALERILESDAHSAVAARAARALARACEGAISSPDNAEIVGHAAPPDESTQAVTDTQQPPPHFVAIHGDPSFAKILGDVCANRARVTELVACTDATEFLNDGCADLLLLDLDCPGCPSDSVAALHRKARSLNIPVVAMVSNRRSAAVVHALSEGEIECLLKPVEAALLHRKLFELLERRRLVAIVCDDDPVIREFLRPRLESRGFQVELANDGEKLLDLAQRIRPSIIILDRVMPGMDGLDVLQQLKSTSATHRIPVILLTSRNQPQDIAQGLRSGAAAYMIKPFSPDQVLAKCLEILGLDKSRRA